MPPPKGVSCVQIISSNGSLRAQARQGSLFRKAQKPLAASAPARSHAPTTHVFCSFAKIRRCIEIASKDR
eukprot:220572-Heterocapsa_arctica.AAC.1